MEITEEEYCLLDLDIEKSIFYKTNINKYQISYNNLKKKLLTEEEAIPSPLYIFIVKLISFGFIDIGKKYRQNIENIKSETLKVKQNLQELNSRINHKLGEIKLKEEDINRKRNLWLSEIKTFEYSLYPNKYYIQKNQALLFNEKLKKLLQKNSRYNLIDDIKSKSLNLLYNDPLQWQRSAIKFFYQEESKTFEKYFNSVESNPLTESQQKAVMSNELNNLVIAGAGSGKTSVVIARVGYLIEKKMAKVEEILVLAFNIDAAKEVEERIQEKLKINVEVKTFHAYGNMVYNFHKKRKIPCSFHDKKDKTAYKKHLRNLLENMLKENQDFYNEFTQYFLESFYDTRPLFDFKTEAEYNAYIRQQELRALEGSLLRSSEELTISNFLTLNGIAHKYEFDYKYNTETITRRQYKPDFYLPDYDIYIEHFGITKDGKTAPYIDSEKYNEDMEWKINLHKEKKTILVQTFSYEMSDRVLLKSLKAKLEKYEVKFTPLPFKEALDKFHELHVIDNFTNLIESFLNHFKSNNLIVDDLYKRVSTKQKRENAFISIFGQFFTVYEKFKQEHNCIDFHDMILQANISLENKDYKPNYKYIIVDEFQDISIARNNLLTLIRNSTQESVITAVGDDWQAINRFAGSDVGIIKNFSNYFGDTETVMLDKTFRFDDKINKVSANFIMKNDTQIQKNISTHNKADKATIFLHWYNKQEEDYLGKIIKHICNKHDTKNKTLMILGRNKYAFPENINDVIKENQNSFLTKTVEDEKTGKKKTINGIRKMNVHGSKGLEDDFVILTGLQENIVGFPTKLEDDPILKIILSSPEKKAFAEERRLFYVALTRVKKELHLVVEEDNPSSFVKEIMKDFPNDIVEVNKRMAIDSPCPKCPTGLQKKQLGEYGYFITCTNYPKCDFVLKNIPKCKECGDIYYRDSTQYICSNKECNDSKEICPICGGMLFIKNGKKGDFIGCSNYQSKNCTYCRSLC